MHFNSVIMMINLIISKNGFFSNSPLNGRCVYGSKRNAVITLLLLLLHLIILLLFCASNNIIIVIVCVSTFLCVIFQR